jgi:site-specific DNA-cytosine methylase
VQAYRQAGNSIVVNVLEELIKEILKSGVFDE